MASNCHKEDENHGGCLHASTNPSVHQTLQELDFDRGIWSSALSGDFADVEKKLKKDPSIVNKCDQSGYTALHYASRNGHVDICKLLIDEYRASVNVTTTSTKATPLHRAAYMGHSDIVFLLLKHGADVSITDCDGKNAIDKAKERGHDKVVTILQEVTKKKS